MLAPVSNARKDGRSSFRALKKYILTEFDPETSEQKYRGDYMISDTILALETADAEMRAVATNNPRAKDPVFHYQLAWQPGEQPTKEQWQEAVTRSLTALQFEEHQFVAAAHHDKKHFHVHVMVNRIHPETYMAKTPKFYKRELDKSIRQIEHDQGWKESNGLYRWDAVLGEPALNSPEEMVAMWENGKPHGSAAKIEHYNDIESFQTYVRQNAATELHTLLQKPRVRWADVHQLLISKGLMLEKGEKGGYTIRAINQGIWAKASNVFRQDFAGKNNRARTENILGAWEAPGASDLEPEKQYMKQPKELQKTVHAPEKRQQSKERLHDQRGALKREFFAYRNERRAAQKVYTQTIRERRKATDEVLKKRKIIIRADKSVSWHERRAAISTAIAEALIQQRLLAARAYKERLGIAPMTYQQWVQQKAIEGDKGAIAQMRGWRYQDQRNVRRIEKEIEEGSRTTIMLMAEDQSDVGTWDKLSNDEVREMEHAESVAQVITSMRMAVHRSTGNVTYILKGKTAFIDRGKAISVVTKDEAATVLALEMAVKKYGPRITIQGNQQWREDVARIAARNNAFIEFTDPGIQLVVQQERTKINARFANRDWTYEKSSVDIMPAPLREQAEKAYKQWIEANPKNAVRQSFEQYVEFRQGPRAAVYRRQADLLNKICDSLLRKQANFTLKTGEEAKLFFQSLYGQAGVAFFSARVAATKAALGKPVETNIQNLAILTTTLNEDGSIQSRVRPADPHQARVQAEVLAGILRQSANEALKLASTPRLKTKIESKKGLERDIGR